MNQAEEEKSPQEFSPELDDLRERVSKLSSIREPRQRMSRLIDIFSEHSALALAYFLRAILQNELIRFDPPTQMIHLDIVRFREVLGELGYKKVSSIYAKSVSEGWADVKALFQNLQNDSGSDEEDIPETFGRQLSSLTLGERRQMSRSNDPRFLEMLVFDSHPRVIRELLMNPRVTLTHVTRLCSRRFCPPAILEEVCRSDRWIKHYNIRKALVFNPSNPLPISLGLVQHLRTADLRLLLQVGRVNESVENKARELIQKKSDL